jgi:hypothetical protein
VAQYWFHQHAPAVNGYERVLVPPQMQCDVAYWLNHTLARRTNGMSLAAINAAVEATSLSDRSCSGLLAQVIKNGKNTTF